MANGSWSNDQLNAIFVYDAQTGQLVLRVDSTGFYYYNVATGSYFRIGEGLTDPHAVAAFWNPADSVVPGVVFSQPGEIAAGESIGTPATNSFPLLNIFSPGINGKAFAAITLNGQSNNSSVDNSGIFFGASYLNGRQSNEIGQGTVDEGGSVSYTSANFTGTEIAADYVSEAYGTFATTRRYGAQWNGTVQSSTAGDRVGLRIYTGPNNNNLTGATQIRDYGQITIAAANIPQPFHVSAPFNGVPGKFGLLAARRVSGSGTCFLTINYRLCQDTVGAY